MSDQLVQITIPNFPQSVKERLEAEARAQDRSLAALLRTIVLRYAARLDSGQLPDAISADIPDRAPVAA